MNLKFFGIVSIVCLAGTILWLILMIVSIATFGPISSMEQAIIFVENQSIVFSMTYINALIITITATILFAGIYLFCRKTDPGLSLIGIIFIPAYTTINLFSYFSQISIVPKLLMYTNMVEYSNESKFLLGMMIQAWDGSLIWILNNSAYAILGFSSMAFGLSLIKKQRYAKNSGIFLILNALASFTGIVGIVVGNKVLGMGSAVGGCFFIFALIFLTLMFSKETERKEWR